MSRDKSLFQKILGGRSDGNIRFADFARPAPESGVHRKGAGEHHIFRREGVAERINLQRDGSQAKPYQARQVRLALLKHELEKEE